MPFGEGAEGHPNVKMFGNPGFKVKEKASNKTTYDGLTFKFMRDYILIQDDCDELMDEFEAVKLENNEKYPIVKKWFLDTFKNEDGKFNMNKAKREITGGKIEAAKVRVKAARRAAPPPPLLSLRPVNQN